MTATRLAAKKRLLALFLTIVPAVGAVSCASGAAKVSTAGFERRARAHIKKRFANVAVPAGVRSLEDVAVAADKDRLALVWISKVSPGKAVVTAAIFDAGGRKSGQADVGEVVIGNGSEGQETIEARSPGVGFDGSGTVVVSWRAVVDRPLAILNVETKPRSVDDLFIARLDNTGLQLTPATPVIRGVSNYGWRGDEPSWDKIITQADGGFRIAWYSSNNYNLKGESLEARYLVTDGTQTQGRAKVVGGPGWAVYQGDPTVGYQRFTAAGLVNGDIIDMPVATPPSPKDVDQIRQVDAIDMDGPGNVFSLAQPVVGRGRAIPGRGAAGKARTVPTETRMTRTDTDLRPVVTDLVVARGTVNVVGGERPVASLVVGSDRVSAVWPKARSRTTTTSWLRQLSPEGMPMGPEREIEPGSGPGLLAALTDKIAVARTSGADMIVDFFSTGSRLYSFRIDGANQGRISSFDNDLIAAWLGSGAKGEELRVGRWVVE